MSVEPMTHPRHLAHQFDDLEQQHSASTLGMWLFLATEVLFFGGLFTAYSVLRYRFFDAFLEGSKLLSLPLGTINTAVLITSSLTMAMSVHAAQKGRRSLPWWLGATVVLGTIFLGIKGAEWAEDYEKELIPGLRWNPAPWMMPHEVQSAPVVAPRVDPRYDPEEPIPPDVVPKALEGFFVTYFLMTALHALHMVIGIGILLFLLVQALRSKYSPDYYTPVEVTGLYWHFVDIIWIFLFPLLYLIRH